MTFKQELRDFLQFLRSPRLSPRLPQQDSGKAWHTDWTNGLGVKRMLQWAGFLWLINITVFGPIAALVATSVGAQHKLDPSHISQLPWKQAILWAPVVEELVFRYVLRRPSQALWVLPISIWALFSGPNYLTAMALSGVIIALLLRPHYNVGFAWPYRWSRYYARYFGWVFYISTVLFAALHLYNFTFSQVPWWFLPLLILPQFATGLVLAWLRVRRGIGASVVLHAVFNAGPMLLIIAVISLLSEQL